MRYRIYTVEQVIEADRLTVGTERPGFFICQDGAETFYVRFDEFAGVELVSE
jgi:hypothetical protein